jgi:glycosyltransferase involved in cell wall biosynthesis
MMPRSAIGVSFVVPVHNGAGCVRATLEAIAAQADGRPMEIIVVDDCSTDGSPELLRGLSTIFPLDVLPGDGRGAAAAINTGVRAARYPIICQVDQDVVVGHGWMPRLVSALHDPDVGAAQGYYTNDPRATRCARAMGLDLEQRYAAIPGPETDHVCTGNSAYRASALRDLGLFDEALGYGYDNDMSYRLRAAGYRLAFCPAARSVHRWREGFIGYLRQQYGFGYGRIDVVAKHPRRAAGDSVSPAGMMLHPIVTALALAAALMALPVALASGPWRAIALAAASMLGVLAVERSIAGARAAWRFRDSTALLFPALHLARDLAWVAAMTMWVARLVLRRTREPFHSMRPGARPAQPAKLMPVFHGDSAAAPARPARILGIIPAYNEAANLAAVVAEMRASRPGLDILVVDDGSIDGTLSLLQSLDVQWLHFLERLGIGGTMRAGLRYAARLGYDGAVRIDGDGQHRADDIERMLGPLRHGADVVMGSRYLRSIAAGGATPFPKRLLAFCLSALTRQRVTDPTSGFCAIGPRAMALLAEHHPTGYPEPELRLFLSRNGLRVVEVPVRERSRLGGNTSLTAGRLAAAGARVLLAMLIVPLRRAEGRL